MKEIQRKFIEAVDASDTDKILEIVNNEEFKPVIKEEFEFQLPAFKGQWNLDEDVNCMLTPHTRYYNKPNLLEEKYYRPIYYAIGRKLSVSILLELIHNAAIASEDEYFIVKDNIDFFYNELLKFAARYNSIEDVKHILTENFIVEPISWFWVIQNLIANKHDPLAPEIEKYVRLGANLQMSNEFDNFLIHHATVFDNPDALMYLLDKACVDINVDCDEYDAHFYSLLHKKYSCAIILLYMNCNLSKRDDYGFYSERLPELQKSIQEYVKIYIDLFTAPGNSYIGNLPNDIKNEIAKKTITENFPDFFDKYRADFDRIHNLIIDHGLRKRALQYPNLTINQEDNINDMILKIKIEEEKLHSKESYKTETIRAVALNATREFNDNCEPHQIMNDYQSKKLKIQIAKLVESENKNNVILNKETRNELSDKILEGLISKDKQVCYRREAVIKGAISEVLSRENETHVQSLKRKTQELENSDFKRSRM